MSGTFGSGPWHLGQPMIVGHRNYGTISSIVRCEGRGEWIGTVEYRHGRRVTRCLFFDEGGAITHITGPETP